MYKDPTWTSEKYHGKGNTTFRGTGPYYGSQITYDPSGKVIDSGPYQGTFDYVPVVTNGYSGDYLIFNLKKHDDKDIVPHEADKKYTDYLSERN